MAEQKQWSTSSASRSYLTEFYEEWKGRLGNPLLDIGCGSGKFLYRAALDGRRDIYGCDISSQLIDIAREKLHPFLKEKTETRVITLDMLKLSQHYGKEFFRSLIFSGVLQQTLMSGARPTLQEIAYISVPGAIVYFSTRSISTPPTNGTRVEGERGTFRLPDGVCENLFHSTRYHKNNR